MKEILDQFLQGIGEYEDEYEQEQEDDEDDEVEQESVDDNMGRCSRVTRQMNRRY